MNEITDSAILAALRRQMATAVAKQATAASNLANLDTPGYKAREVSFADALPDLGVGPLAATGAQHLQSREAGTPGVVEKQGLPERRDGNNVQLDRELLALTRASGDFSAALAGTPLRDLPTTGVGRVAATMPMPRAIQMEHGMRTETVELEQDLETRDDLVMEHVGMVKRMASHLANRLPAQVERSDLVSVGVIGLMDAARRFKPNLGVPFGAFARRRIHGAMLDSLRALDSAPRAVRKMRREIDGAMARLRSELQREPEGHEIAQALNVSEAEYDKRLEKLRSADLATVRQTATDLDGQSLLEARVDQGEGPHARVERLELTHHLAEAIVELPDRERRILALYYEEELTLAEIAEVIGVGESRVSQLRTQAIASLRSMLAPTYMRLVAD